MPSLRSLACLELESSLSWLAAPESSSLHCRQETTEGASRTKNSSSVASRPARVCSLSEYSDAYRLKRPSPWSSAGALLQSILSQCILTNRQTLSRQSHELRRSVKICKPQDSQIFDEVMVCLPNRQVFGQIDRFMLLMPRSMWSPHYSERRGVYQANQMAQAIDHALPPQPYTECFLDYIYPVQLVTP